MLIVLVAAKLLFWTGVEAFSWWLGCKTAVDISGFEAFHWERKTVGSKTCKANA